MSSSMLQSLVDSNSAVLDLFTIMSQDFCIDTLIKHPRFLPDTVERLIDSAADFRREIFRIVLEAGKIMPV